jgi:hypothetical protein
MLVAKVAETHLRDLPDWQVAQVLNAPDATLPVIVDKVTTLIGPDSIMQCLGNQAGALLLDALESAVDNKQVKWFLATLRSKQVDISSDSARAMVETIAELGIITAQQVVAIKALGESMRYPSWAQHYNVEVTARTVGIARGAKE